MALHVRIPVWLCILFSMFLFETGEAVLTGTMGLCASIAGNPELAAASTALTTASTSAVTFSVSTRGWGARQAPQSTSSCQGAGHLVPETKEKPDKCIPTPSVTFKGAGAYAKAEAYLADLARNPHHVDGHFNVHQFCHHRWYHVKKGPGGEDGNWANVTFNCHRAGKFTSRKKQANNGTTVGGRVLLICYELEWGLWVLLSQPLCPGCS